MPETPIGRSFLREPQVGNSKNFRESAAPEARDTSRAASFFAGHRLRPNGMSYGGGNFSWEWVAEREGDRLICDTCRTEEGLYEIIKLASLNVVRTFGVRALVAHHTFKNNEWSRHEISSVRLSGL
jgi:hypothetical protein